MMRTSGLLRSFFLLLLALLLGCSGDFKTATPTPYLISLYDGGVLSREPCGPPCFYGMEAGKSTLGEVEQILKKEKSFVGGCQFDESVSYVGEKGLEEFSQWSCRDVSIVFRKDTQIVESIKFSPARPLTLEDIIAQYNDPDFLVLLDTGLPEYPETMGSIYYSDFRMILFPVHDRVESYDFPVMADTLIAGVTYLDEQSWEDELHLFEDSIVPWSGYRIY